VLDSVIEVIVGILIIRDNTTAELVLRADGYVDSIVQPMLGMKSLEKQLNEFVDTNCSKAT